MDKDNFKILNKQSFMKVNGSKDRRKASESKLLMAIDTKVTSKMVCVRAREFIFIQMASDTKETL